MNGNNQVIGRFALNILVLLSINSSIGNVSLFLKCLYYFVNNTTKIVYIMKNNIPDVQLINLVILNDIIKILKVFLI